MLCQTVDEILNKYCHPEDLLLIAISGGIDSAVLLDIASKYCKKKDIKLHAAHFVHNWAALKPEWAQEEKEEELFCVNTCNKLNIPLHIGHAQNFKVPEEKIASTRHSYEAQAREQRRSFLKKTAKKLNTKIILLAHHADDQIETFFIRIIRGASLEGLCCMREYDGLYLRPLLNIEKKEIIKYVQNSNIAWCHDTGNDDQKFLRNKLRSILMPQLNLIDQRFEKAILKTIDSINIASDELLNRLKDDFNLVYDQEKRSINLTLLDKYSLYTQKFIIKEFLIKNNYSLTISSMLINELLRFIKNNKNQHNIGTYIFIKEQNILICKNSRSY